MPIGRCFLKKEEGKIVLLFEDPQIGCLNNITKRLIEDLA